MHHLMNKCVDSTKPHQNLHKQHLTIIVGASSSTPSINFLLPAAVVFFSVHSPKFSFCVKIRTKEVFFMLVCNISVAEKHESYAVSDCCFRS